MRTTIVAAVLTAVTAGWCLSPGAVSAARTGAASPAGGTALPAAGAVPAAARAVPAAARAVPVSGINVNGNGGDRVYDGVGAVLGGGGNARYLMDYPEPERGQILDYLFKPGYGASLQLLKLEIGGGAGSSDGSEPSIEPVQGQINCNAGYELSIAAQAVARNPASRCTASSGPRRAGSRTAPAACSPATTSRYLIDWLGCAARPRPGHRLPRRLERVRQRHARRVVPQPAPGAERGGVRLGPAGRGGRQPHLGVRVQAG